MGSTIVRLQDSEGEIWLYWSSEWDQATHVFATRADFEAFYREEYGNDGMRELPERMSRVDAKGTSDYDDESAEDTVVHNRAGASETRLTVPQLIAHYRARLTDPECEPPMGVDDYAP